MRGYAGTSNRATGPPLLVAEKLYGIRSWRLRIDDRGRLRLGAFNAQRPFWERAGESTTAVCGRDRRHRQTPAGRCTCGLYAFHAQRGPANHLFFIAANPGDETAVIGIVEAWGTVQVHREGFRAQHARPLALALLGYPRESEYGALVADVALSHHVPIVEEENLEGLVRHCRAEGLGLGPDKIAALLREGG